MTKKDMPKLTRIQQKELDEIVLEIGGTINKSPIKKQHNINVVSYDPDFFKNFEIIIEGKKYYFLPWDEKQKNFLNGCLNNFKNLILKYSEKPKDGSKKFPKFPYKEFKEKVISVLENFFHYSNLKLEFDLDNKLEELYNEEPKNSNVKKENLRKKITSKNLLKDEKTLASIERLIEKWSKPRSREDLKDILLKQKEEESKKISKQIVKNVLNKFFPQLEYNIKENNKKVIIKQIENFVRTIENSINQVV
jgi:hypothetical protein